MKRRAPDARSAQTSKLMRIACVVFASIFILQGYLVKIGSLPQGHYINDETFWSLTIAAVLLTLAVLLYPRATIPRPLALVRVLAIEFVGIGFIITSTGFGSLLSLALIFVLYESYILYKAYGLSISIALLAAAVGYEMYQSTYLGFFNTIDTLIALLTILSIALLGVALIRAQSVRYETLEKSRAQANLEKYRITTLMNNLAQGVLSLDRKGVVRLYNAAALNILDTNSSLNNQHIDDILNIKNAEGKHIHPSALLKNIQSTEVFDDLYFHNGEEVARLEISVTPIRAGRQHGKLDIDQGFILLVRDVTKQKNLDDERDEFISVVSHELRTPLTVAEASISNIQALYRKGITSSDRILPALDAAYGQLNLLARITNDLSTLSRAEQGETNDIELLDLDQFLHDLYVKYYTDAKAAGLRFDIDTPAKLGNVRTSRLYLAELLQNLIDNAFKYTKEGSIQLAATRKKDTVTISVTDTGIGIGKADKEKIFDKFYRSEDYRTRETGGTGLGLYVAMKLAAKLNTTIQLKSRLNHGSTFSINLKATDDE